MVTKRTAGVGPRASLAVLVERRGRVMVVTINRPATRNAINGDVWRGIGRALEECELDDDASGVVLTARDKSSLFRMDLKLWRRKRT